LFLWWYESSALEKLTTVDVINYRRLRAAGEGVLDADLAHISPLAFGHIIPNGTYWFDRDLQVADGG
jgi:hypothetical protein